MEPIDLVLKIWGIEEEHQTEVENILKNTSPEHLGLALANLGASSDETFVEQNDAWMKIHFPELRFA